MKHTITVETVRLTKEFDSAPALQNCTLQINQGEIYGILGANGAGKTTLLKLLTGLLEPTDGIITVLGMNIDTNRSTILRSIGSLIEVPCFYDHLTAKENLEIHLSYMGIHAAAMDDIIPKVLKQLGLDADSRKPVSKYSLGMRQRLAIARSISHSPKILLLDEPINGLDPVAIRDMRILFRELARQGITILISSHILSELQQTADRILILRKGCMILEEPMKTLTQKYGNDLEAYLIRMLEGGE